MLFKKGKASRLKDVAHKMHPTQKRDLQSRKLDTTIYLDGYNGVERTLVRTSIASNCGLKSALHPILYPKTGNIVNYKMHNSDSLLYAPLATI